VERSNRYLILNIRRIDQIRERNANNVDTASVTAKVRKSAIVSTCKIDAKTIPTLCAKTGNDLYTGQAKKN